MVWTATFTWAGTLSTQRPGQCGQPFGPASSGSPPCRMTSTPGDRCRLTCSAMRSTTLAAIQPGSSAWAAAARPDRPSHIHSSTNTTELQRLWTFRMNCWKGTGSCPAPRTAATSRSSSGHGAGMPGSRRTSSPGPADRVRSPRQACTSNRSGSSSGEYRLERRRRQPMQRQRQADPGVRVADRPRRRSRRGRPRPRPRASRDQETVGLAEREHPVGAQLPVARWRQVAHVQQAAPDDGVDLPDVSPRSRPLGRSRSRRGLAPPVGGRQARHARGIERQVPELPGQPVVERDLGGDLPSPRRARGSASSCCPWVRSRSTNRTPAGVRQPVRSRVCSGEVDRRPPALEEHLGPEEVIRARSRRAAARPRSGRCPRWA